MTRHRIFQRSRQIGGSLFWQTGQLRQSAPGGFTLVEVIVVIAILALLAAILLPSLATSRAAAYKASCASNLHQIGLAVLQYAQDHDEFQPFDDAACTAGVNGAGGDPFSRDGGWVSELLPYARTQRLFQCPAASELTATQASLGLTYWANGPLFSQCTTPSKPVPLAAIRGAAHVVLLYDDLGAHGREQMLYRLFWNGSFWTDNGDFAATLTQPGPHVDHVNVSWADGHVKAISKPTLKNIVLSMSVWP